MASTVLQTFIYMHSPGGITCAVKFDTAVRNVISLT